MQHLLPSKKAGALTLCLHSSWENKYIYIYEVSALLKIIFKHKKRSLETISIGIIANLLPAHLLMRSQVEELPLQEPVIVLRKRVRAVHPHSFLTVFIVNFPSCDHRTLAQHS